MHVSGIAVGSGTEYLRYTFVEKVTVTAVEANDLDSAPVRCAVQICPINDDIDGCALAHADSTYVAEPIHANGRWHLDVSDSLQAVFQYCTAGDRLFLGFQFQKGWL